jgi:hypothetical protein
MITSKVFRIRKIPYIFPVVIQKIMALPLLAGVLCIEHVQFLVYDCMMHDASTNAELWNRENEVAGSRYSMGWWRSLTRVTEDSRNDDDALRTAMMKVGGTLLFFYQRPITRR